MARNFSSQQASQSSVPPSKAPPRRLPGTGNMANVRGSRAPADMIQACVEIYARSVFEAPDDALPDVPISSLDDAAFLLAATFASGDLSGLRQSVGEEFLERLALRWRGADNQSRHAIAL